MNGRRYKTRGFLLMQKALTLLFLTIFAFSDLATLIGMPKVEQAEAAQVTIDATAQVAAASHLHAGSQTVFISDQVGYKFYRDALAAATGECVYSKTTDGGATWGAAVLIDDQGAGTDCLGISVWYDRWTPGDTTGNFIHVVTFDDGTDDVFYNRVDTANSDTRLLGSTAVAASTNPAQNPTNSIGINSASITKGTDGTLYIAQDDTADSFVVECSASCNLAASWTQTSVTPPQDLADDYSILVPMLNGNIMLINRDTSADDIRSKIWRNGAAAWDAAWTTIDAAAADSTTYDIGMAVTVASSTSGAATTTIFLAYTADNDTFVAANDDIRTARFGPTGWSARTALLTNDTKGLTNVAIGRDTNNGTLYVAYTGRTTIGTANTANVYWKSSTDQMSTWSTESAVMNSSADDFYGLDLNISSNQRLYATWFDLTDGDIYGDTLIDLVPGIRVTANGSQVGTTTAAFTNTHIGGSFALAEQATSRDVTGVTISESGTIDGSTAVENIKLFYEMDTTNPYNCASVSYGGTESQFGSTDTNGFSGANGSSAFSGTSVAVSTTSAMCIYVVLDVNDTVTGTGQTLNVTINNPSTDVSVTNGGEVVPATAVDITGNTPITNDNLTQIHYHWRNDDGSEALATSKTGGTQDTSFAGYQKTPVRLRMEVSNEGNATSPSNQYRLEYSLATTTCSLMGGWTDVGASNDDINMFNSTNLTDGNNTSNIATANLGAMTDENTTFLSPNTGVKDTSSQTGSITLTSTQFVELEYSITASTTADNGDSYCFRLTNAGTPLKTYTQYPLLTVSADINLTASGTQSATLNVPSTNQYLGGKFVFIDGTGTHTITGVTLTENGTVNAQTGLDNIRLKYDLDTAAPYDCASVSYNGTEPQFGATSTASFSGANGTTTITGSLLASTTRAVCMYVVLDVTNAATNGQTIEVEVSNATNDVTISSGSVAPSTPRALSGTTNLVGAILTQAHYHWRNDNGTEAAATSLTSGIQDTSIDYIPQNQQIRLRMEVSNEGSITSPNTALRLEYGTKVTSCTNVSSWTDVGAVGGAFDMFATANLTEGGNTTNIANGIGGMTDENSSYKAANAAVKDTSSQIATTTFTTTEYFDAEFSIKQTANAAFDATYCFRLSNAGTALQAYTNYPELTTSPERDFEIQRGTTSVTGTGVTLTAGVDYVAPATTSAAFVRITNSHYTGAGVNAAGGTQNADDVTAYISNPTNIMTSFTITRPTTAINNTRVSWEIVEFIGSGGSDNEMKVRGVGTVTYGTTATVASGTALANITDDSDVVVFITGQFNPDTAAANYNTGQSISEWNANSNTPVFRRGDSGSDASRVSYAVVEFTGVNWKTQRVSHTYTAAGSTETENITAVNSLTRTFVHSQKRNGAGLVGTDEFGHEVWLSSIGAVSFFLESGATTPSGQTSVAWIIENTQTSIGSMVVTRSDGSSNGGAEPLSLSVAIGTTLDDLTNASIFASTRGAGTGNLYPRPIAGFTIASSTHYELWRSDTGTQVNYRVEVVEWPTAGLAFRQNDYRIYADNNLLDPDDPWPVGTTSDLGENTVLTGSDEPLGDGEHARIRLSINPINATFPEQSESFKLQYGERVSTCGAISEASWFDVGALGSGTVWRGYDAPGISDGVSLGSDPANAGELNLAASDIAATYEDVNPSAVNPYRVEEGEDVEYDWHIEQNGANAETFYCFRMIRFDGTPFAAYLDYPQIRTSSFTARSQNWRFYGDVNNETPSSALSSENSAPIDIANGSTTKLRITIKEIENIARDDVRFKLQYSEYANFATVHDVVSTSTCTASSTWCYYNGGGNDNAVITTKVLSDADACASSIGDGCGTHNEGPDIKTGFRHENSAATEYEFSLIARAPRANAVYFFRLYDVVQNVPVTTNIGESYPSLVIEGASLVFSMAGITQGTNIDGETMSVTTSPGQIPFGSVPFDTDYTAGYRLSLNTNATEGYQVLMFADQDLINEYGGSIPPVTGTNAFPQSWSDGCIVNAVGCFGYHPSDDSLSGANPSRFAPPTNMYAALSTNPEEVMYSSIPADNTHDIVYKLMVSTEQTAGIYEARINFLAIPTF
jgi:hypothetical protein